MEQRPAASPSLTPILRAPFVGREIALEQGLASLRSVGCLIAGGAGVGKSRLAAEIARRHPAEALVVTATTSSSAIPFGAFAQYGPTSARLDGRFVQSFVEWMRERNRGEIGLVLIDDAQLLDPGAATLALALVTSEPD